MPIRTVIQNGRFYKQWGTHGALYQYNPDSPPSEEAAYQKALRQGRAIHARKRR